MTAEMEKLIADAELIADAIIRRWHPIEDELSTREAYKAYGRAWVEDAVAKRDIHPYKIGQKICYSRTELDALRSLQRHKACAIVPR